MFNDVHTFFGLSYANYLVWPRSIMQSMPDEWQKRFCRLAIELDEAVEQAGLDWDALYQVKALDPSWHPDEDRVWLGTDEEYEDDDLASDPDMWADSEPRFVTDRLADYQRGRRNVFSE